MQHTLPMTRPGAVPPEAPPHLEAPERALWAELTAAFMLDDAGSAAVLRTALEAHARARRCREAIDAAGEAVVDRFGQTKPHPLLAAERDARAAFLTGMKALHLAGGAEP